MQTALHLKGITKKYPEFTLGPLDLELEPGAVLAYIGPNGSGKTTTMHCINGLVKHSSGSVTVFGKENDPQKPEWKLDIGYVGDTHPFFEGWNGAKNLKFISQFYPNWSGEKAKTLAQRFELDLSKKVKSLSTGNRVKLALISALAHEPKLLLLDEPTSGLDPVVRAEVLDVLFEILESGESAILYSTHILSDIARIADELVFLKNGNIRQRTPKDDLIESWRKITCRYDGAITGLKNAASIRRDGSDHQIISSDFSKTVEALRERGVENIQENRMSIDEIAIEILKGGNDA